MNVVQDERVVVILCEWLRVMIYKNNGLALMDMRRVSRTYRDALDLVMRNIPTAPVEWNRTVVCAQRYLNYFTHLTDVRHVKLRRRLNVKTAQILKTRTDQLVERSALHMSDCTYTALGMIERIDTKVKHLRLRFSRSVDMNVVLGVIWSKSWDNLLSLHIRGPSEIKLPKEHVELKAPNLNVFVLFLTRNYTWNSYIALLRTIPTSIRYLSLRSFNASYIFHNDNATSELKRELLRFIYLKTISIQNFVFDALTLGNLLSSIPLLTRISIAPLNFGAALFLLNSLHRHVTLRVQCTPSSGQRTPITLIFPPRSADSPLLSLFPT